MKNSVIDQFDPNGTGVEGNLFGMPFTIETAQVVIVPIAWEVTVSYQTGTSLAPEAIKKASIQIDLCSKEIENVWSLGIALYDTDRLKGTGEKLRELALRNLESGEERKTDETSKVVATKINEGCENLHVFIKSITKKLLSQGKMIGILGGDHSVPLGFLKALSEKNHEFGILQIDAHADLRKSYQNFSYSHASIMHQALKLKSVSKLIQLGVRDFCEQELEVMQNSGNRIKTFFDADIKESLYNGVSWDSLCNKIINEMPNAIYISFDIDGLDPKFCPNTGTPVPGGLESSQVMYLVKKLVMAGKRIIGFDLCEVSGSHEWDANVGSRILFELINWMAVSQGKLKLRKKMI